MAEGEMTGPLRLGVVGCDVTRATFGTACTRTDEVDVVAVMDSDMPMARIWSRRARSAKVWWEFAPFLREAQVEAALVSGPSTVCAPRVRALLEAGIAVLAVPPFASTLEEEDDLVSLARRMGRPLIPALTARHEAYWNRAARLLAEGRLGSDIVLRCDLSTHRQHSDHRAAGNSWRDEMDAMLRRTAEPACAWLGAALTVSADVDLREAPGTAPNLANMIVTHERGTSIHHLSRLHRRHLVEQFVFHGRDGMLVAATSGKRSPDPFQPWTMSLQSPGGGEVDVAPVSSLLAGPEAMDPYLALLRDFVRAVRQGATPLSGMDQMRELSSVVAAAHHSSMAHVRVSLPLTGSAAILKALEDRSAAR